MPPRCHAIIDAAADFRRRYAITPFIYAAFDDARHAILDDAVDSLLFSPCYAACLPPPSRARKKTER